MATTHTITAETLDEAVTSALRSLLRTGAGERHAETSTLVFSGEGSTPEAATRDALADVVAQCEAHGSAPLSITTDGVMRIDEGYRVWGTAGCSESGSQSPTMPGAISFDISEEEGRGWTVTVNEA